MRSSNAYVQLDPAVIEQARQARSYFARVGADLIAHFARLGSRCTELNAEENTILTYIYITDNQKAMDNVVDETIR